MSHKFIPGIASQSLGNPQYHGIHAKLEAAATAGLRSIEIFYEDIAQLAKQFHHDPNVLAPRFQPTPACTTPGFSYQDEVLLSCSGQIRQWCFDTTPHSLEVICLQPFMHYEGLLDEGVRDGKMRKLELWIQIAKHLGTTLIQIPSNFLSERECTGDRARIVEDLRKVAEIGAQQMPVIRFAYEALCWGTHVNTWDAAWNIVKGVDRDNFGTCLDTFNIAGRIYADPEEMTGKNGSADIDLAISLQKLRDTFSDAENLKKVFYVELCDGERLGAPLNEKHAWYNTQQPARMTWSRKARLFPFETDVEEAMDQGRMPGYLPVDQIFDVLLDVGYEGFLSFEVFSRSLNVEGEHVVWEHQKRAAKAWQRCAKHIDDSMASKARRELGVNGVGALTTAEDDINTLLLEEPEEVQESIGATSGDDLFSISSRL